MARRSIGGHFQQEVDLPALLKDVAGDFVQVCMSPDQVRHLVDRALRIARSRRCVTAIILPADVQEAAAVEVPHEHGAIPSGIDYTEPLLVPEDADLRRAAAILNRGRRVAMLLGAGAREAGEEAIAVADILGAGVAKALLGKTVLSDDQPFVTGQIGLLGTRPSYEMMRDCDTLLMVGSTFPYSEFLPEEGRAKAVQIDSDPAMLSLRYPMDVSLVGDAGKTLAALRPLLQAKSDRKWRATIERNVAAWWEEEERRAHIAAEPLNPELFFWEFSQHIPERAVIATDTGMSTSFVARALRMRPGMSMMVSGTLATMGPAISYGLAAKLAEPDRPVFAFVGDGAMQMLGINALITVAKYARGWRDPRFVVAVLNNRDLNMVTWELRAAGSPKVDETQDLPDFDYARYGELLGFVGLRVDRPEDVRSAWSTALAADRPVVIDVRADPTVPVFPPHVTARQARRYFTALRRGDGEAQRVLRQTISHLYP
jgi:pyruvate dehydrogenase (quinone)